MTYPTPASVTVRPTSDGTHRRYITQLAGSGCRPPFTETIISALGRRVTEDNGPMCLGGEEVTSQSCAEATQRVIDDEVAKLLRQAVPDATKSAGSVSRLGR